jgi:hypothetical protein
MKIRTDFVTNYSTSSFVTYRISDKKFIKEFSDIYDYPCPGLASETDVSNYHIIKQALYASYETAQDAKQAITYLNEEYSLRLNNRDIQRLKTESNYDEFTLRLEELYGVDVSSYMETEVYQNKQKIGYEIEFMSEVKICKDYLNEVSAIEAIKKFISTYGSGNEATQVVDAYYLAFEQEGMPGEDILELLGIYALILSD